MELCDIINNFSLYPIEIFNNIKDILYNLNVNNKLPISYYNKIFNNIFIIDIMNNKDEINIIKDNSNIKYVKKLYKYLCNKIFNEYYEECLCNKDYILLIRLKNTLLSYLYIITNLT